MLDNAIAQQSVSDRRKVIFQRWVAENKLKYLGFKHKCFINLPKKEQRLTLILLVERYNEKAINNKAVIRLITYLLKQGCDINAYEPGLKLTALHAAIALSTDTSLVNLLLKKGANIQTPVLREKAKGLNAIEWAEKLISLRKKAELPTKVLEEIVIILRNYKNKRA